MNRMEEYLNGALQSLENYDKEGFKKHVESYVGELEEHFAGLVVRAFPVVRKPEDIKPAFFFKTSPDEFETAEDMDIIIEVAKDTSTSAPATIDVDLFGPIGVWPSRVTVYLNGEEIDKTGLMLDQVALPKRVAGFRFTRPTAWSVDVFRKVQVTYLGRSSVGAYNADKVYTLGSKFNPSLYHGDDVIEVNEGLILNGLTVVRLRLPNPAASNEVTSAYSFQITVRVSALQGHGTLIGGSKPPAKKLPPAFKKIFGI